MLPDLTEWGSGLKPRIFPQMLLNIGHYRPQRSCGKVIQYFTGICQSFCSQGGEGGVWQTPQGRHPQEDTLPGQTPPHAQCILGYTPSAQCMLGYTPRRQTIPPCSGHAGILIPPAATAADGTHPTGMHSCFNISLLWDQKLAKPSYLYDVWLYDYQWNECTSVQLIKQNIRCWLPVRLFKTTLGPLKQHVAPTNKTE